MFSPAPKKKPWHISDILHSQCEPARSLALLKSVQCVAGSGEKKEKGWEKRIVRKRDK